MNQKKKQNRIKFGFLIVAIQILLLVNVIPAESYILNQADFLNNNGTIIKNNSGNLIDSVLGLTSLLIGFFSIKQIGIVSAQEVNFNCCVETNNGAICQNIPSDLSFSDPESCSNPLPISCEETSICKPGTCIYQQGLSCAANSPRGECEDNGGVWEPQEINEVLECKKGVCVLGSDLGYTTEKQCELLSASRGLEMDFRPGFTEFDFPEIFENLPKGACVLEQGNCRFVTAIECDSMSGNFYEDFLCSNLNLATNCTPTQETTCIKDKVYFIDSCGNPANIYDSSKVNADENPDYWAMISESGCTLDLENPDSIKSCGNCNLFLSSQCSEASEGNADYGDYACRDLRCTDEKGNKREIGEKWCIYDGYVGDGKDTVGSEHWLAYCDNNGEIEVDMCGGTRGQICEQRVIEENGVSFSTAACVVNEAFRCLESNRGEEGCNENPQCQIKNIDVDEGFQFSLCTPKYPRGFDLRNPDGSSRVCSAANNICRVVYVKQQFGGWECVQNCECETIKFAEQLNDLCISLGDCGSYVNYQGDGTNNIIVENAPSVSWSRYKGFADIVEGQYAELGGLGSSVSPIRTSINPESGFEGSGVQERSEIIDYIDLGISGLGYVDSILKGLEVFSDIGLEGAIKVAIGGSFSSFAISTATGIIAGFVGGAIADAIGLQGPSAQVFEMAFSMAVTATLSMEAFGGSGLLPFPFDFIFGDPLTMLYVAIAMMVISAIMGSGLFGGGEIKIIEVRFTCMPWQAPSGGDNCEKCNEDPLKPCTQYRCDSLGQACNLINENTDNPLCVSTKSEVIPPVISSGEIKTSGYKFQNPQSKKVQIRKDDGGCIQEFTSVLFTLKTDEPAQCKWGLDPTANYESMTRYLAEGTQYSLEHNLGLQGLSLSVLEASNVSGDMIEGLTGDISLYVRCQDVFGNFNLNEYVVSFCVQSGKDVTPVSHSSTITWPRNEEKLSYGISEVNLTMWVNEPAECKYDLIQGKDYNEMANSFSCKTGLIERDFLGWRCYSYLTGLGSENTFYIKCNDQPWFGNNQSERNTNVEDFVYRLYVTETELNIDSVYILYNDVKTDLNFESFTEIKGGGNLFSVELGVETSEGTNNGVSLCSYQWNNDWIPFLNSNSNSHKQKFNLVNGNYNIPIKCEDEAGNRENKNAMFSLRIDNNPPIAVRAYYESGKLNLITDEQAKCYFSFDELKQCNFNTEDVEDMETGFSLNHWTNWINRQTYYIKCEDVWENQNPGCAMKIITS